MSMFENFGKKKVKTEKKIEQEKRQERINNTEYMTGLDSLSVTTEYLDKMDKITETMKETENHDGVYVETEYDLKKQEMQKNVKENFIKKSNWTKATVIQGFAAAGLVTDLVFGGPMSSYASNGLEADQIAYLTATASGILATTVSAGISIVKGIKNKIKEKLETNKSMAKFLVGKVEDFDDEESDIIAKDENGWDGINRIKELWVDRRSSDGVRQGLESDEKNARKKVSSVRGKFQK